MRQRRKCAASAGTNGGGLASLAAPRRIWNIPWRQASGTLRKNWQREPSLESWRLNAKLLTTRQPGGADKFLRLEWLKRVGVLRRFGVRGFAGQGIDDGLYIHPAIEGCLAKKGLVAGLVGGQFAQGRRRPAGQPGDHLLHALHRVADDEQRIHLADYQFLAGGEQDGERVQQHVPLGGWVDRRLFEFRAAGDLGEYRWPPEELLRAFGTSLVVKGKMENSRPRIFSVLSDLPVDTHFLRKSARLVLEQVGLVSGVEQEEEAERLVVVALPGVPGNGKRQLALRQAGEGVQAQTQVLLDAA